MFTDRQLPAAEWLGEYLGQSSIIDITTLSSTSLNNVKFTFSPFLFIPDSKDGIIFIFTGDDAFLSRGNYNTINDYPNDCSGNKCNVSPIDERVYVFFRSYDPNQTGRIYSKVHWDASTLMQYICGTEFPSGNCAWDKCKGLVHKLTGRIVNPIIANRNFANLNLVDKEKFSFKIRSEKLTGNILEFAYGKDENNLKKTPFKLNTTEWQEITIPISEEVNKSEITYIAFLIGEDEIDLQTGETRENTIFIDELTAE